MGKPTYTIKRESAEDPIASGPRSGSDVPRGDGISSEDRTARVAAMANRRGRPEPESSREAELPQQRENPMGTTTRVTYEVGGGAPKAIKEEVMAPRSALGSEEAVGHPLRPKKTPVLISSDTLGRLRLKADYVSVAANVIALGFIDDDASTIVEPPVCTPENPLLVEIAGQEYRCLSGDFSFSLPGPPVVLWVVLVRIPQ